MSNDTIQHLRNLPPFKDLSEESFDSIEQNITHVEFPENLLIIEEGAQGDSLFIIKKGMVQVFINDPDNDEKIVLSKLQKGDYFGEMALITGEPRSASIETLTPVSLLKLDKEGFDKIISENPSISFSLSHMLSQRLKHANLQRMESEKFYHSKITPSGSLSETPFFEILKFCEQNSLSGLLKLVHNDNKARINFVKGNVQNIEMGELSDDEAMDQLMQWQDGTFIIEPNLFSLDEEIHAHLESDDSLAEETGEQEIQDELQSNDQVSDSAPDKTEQEAMERKKLTTEEMMIYLLDRLFNKLIAVIGSQALKDIVAQSKKELEPYFPVINTFQIKIIPQVSIEFTHSDTWDEKKTLAVAVFTQTILKKSQPMVVGMSFLDIKALAGEYSIDLEELSFFEYMQHADEFVV
jgi:CRP-like cAMP-binding protein